MPKTKPQNKRRYVDFPPRDRPPSPPYRQHTVIDRFAGWVTSINYKLIAWIIVSLVLTGILCWEVNAQGLRATLYILGRKLHKTAIPGASYLAELDGFSELDLAHVMAVILLGFVWYFWKIVTKFSLYGHDEVVDPRLNRTVYHAFIFTLAGVMIVGDALVFYAGLADHAEGVWGDSSGPFVPAVATVLYMAVLAATSVVHVHLHVKHDQ